MLTINNLQRAAYDLQCEYEDCNLISGDYWKDYFNATTFVPLKLADKFEEIWKSPPVEWEEVPYQGVL
jgi:hypothetical protein